MQVEVQVYFFEPALSGPFTLGIGQLIHTWVAFVRASVILMISFL